MQMRASPETRLKLKDFETGGKMVKNRLVVLPKGKPALETYLDDVGVPTIGWGHTGKVRGVKLALGMTISLPEAEQLFNEDVGVREDDLSKRLVGGAPTNQNQFDALLLLLFNIGMGNLSTSTLLKKHKAGNYDAAAKQFARWNKGRVGGKLTVLGGLTRRRAEEATLYATPPKATYEVTRVEPTEPPKALPVYDVQESKKVEPEPPKSAATSPTVIGAAVTGATAIPVTIQTVEMATSSVKELRAEAGNMDMVWLTGVLGVLVMLLSTYLIWKRFKDAREGVK